jgi:hypothetical protein
VQDLCCWVELQGPKGHNAGLFPTRLSGVLDLRQQQQRRQQQQQKQQQQSGKRIEVLHKRQAGVCCGLKAVVLLVRTQDEPHGLTQDSHRKCLHV